MGVNGINGFGGTGAPYGYDRFKDAPLVPGAPEEEWEEQAGVEGVEGEEDAEKAEDQVGKKPGRKSSPAECETCKNRKYQDGSDEMVSFKAAGHIDPSNAAMVVMGHEQEHVSNAYRKAELGGGEVERASVRLKTDICPECGRTRCTSMLKGSMRPSKASKEMAPMMSASQLSLRAFISNQTA